MAKTRPFEENASRYENWFERNKFVYRSELQAVRTQIPDRGKGVEIGVGTGRFAAPLGIKQGVEPSARMREIARKRGIDAIDGVAEKLPFPNCRFDYLLMVTSICFLDDTGEALKEAYRVIKPKGCIIIGFVDRDSPVGRQYLRHKNESVFYKTATFYSASEIAFLLGKTGFGNLTFCQTIFRALSLVTSLEPVKEGYGEGSFVVARAEKD